jgi:hypothetical protein
MTSSSRSTTLKIRKHSALEIAEEPEPVPMERTMTAWKVAEWWFGLTEGGVRVSEGSDWNELRAATSFFPVALQPYRALADRAAAAGQRS